jgi:orotidine-5'-phosphate decarboxylase
MSLAAEGHRRAWYTGDMPRSPQLIVALDYPDAYQALDMAQQLAAQRPWVKVGLELLMAAGPQVVADLRDLGLPVFLDGKFLDIPNTVAGAVRGAVLSGATMLNVHAMGGVRMMRAAREEADVTAITNGLPRPLVIAVTVLTSVTSEELRDEIGCARQLEQQVLQLAQRAQEAGLDGVVASPWEAQAIKAACGAGFLVVTPGVRPEGTMTSDDQRRVATPRTAAAAGADFLVVGRPITQATDPVAACAALLADINDAGVGSA